MTGPCKIKLVRNNLLLYLRKVLFVFLIIFLVCFIIEVALRITGYLYLRKLYFDLHLVSLNNTNKAINVVCLGESSTAALGVKWHDSYPKQLEQKLRAFYQNDRIKVIVPPHVGQNTSQVSNRIRQYISLYKPRLIVLMVGCNNTWSFAESHITQFLNNSTKEALKIKILLILDNFRLFKVLRYFYLRFIANVEQLSIKRYILSALGHPESVYERTKIWTGSFVDANKKAFIKLWKYDVHKIIQEAKKGNVKVLLMTYHINPIPHLTVDDFISIADEQHVNLIRNDKSFEPLIKNGTINNYLLYDDWHPDKHWHPNKHGYSIIANNVFEEIRNNNLLDLR